MLVNGIVIYINIIVSWCNYWKFHFQMRKCLFDNRSPNQQTDMRVHRRVTFPITKV